MVESRCSTGSSAADQTLSESSETDSDPEVLYVSSTVNPTTVTDTYWVWAKAPDEIRSSQKTLGKWLVFKQLEELDETWHMIRKAVESGQLGARGAKCSTALEDASCYPMDSSVGVICVYTSEETMDEVGFKLVHMVKQTIRYKTDEATLQGRYIATGYTKVTIKTIFWNDGEPAFTKALTRRRRRGEAKHYPKASVDPSCLPTEPPYTVYLGNLSYDCTEDDVLEFFESRNMNVISVRLPVESGTDRLRGFGYAELENTQALMEALNLSGEPLRGRRVNVDIAGVKKAGRHYHDPYGDHGPPQRYDEGHHYHDPYGDHGPPQRYDEGHHYHDHYGDHGPPQRYERGSHYHDRYGDHGPPQRYERGSHYHDPYGDRGPPRRNERGSHYHDPYGDRGPPRRNERGSCYHDPYGSDGYHPQRRSFEGHHEQDRRRNELPKERPRLQLQPRTKSLEDTSGGRERGEGGRASSSIFGQAKPVDTAAREREIEERLLKERAEREGRGDRSLTDEGRKRGERRNESSQRGDRRGRYNSTGGGERGGRGARREKDRAEREEGGDRSFTDEGGKRGGRRNERSQRQRGDRRGRYDSTGGGERGERGARRKKVDSGRGEREEKYDRNERGERGERYDRNERGERGERYDRNEREEKYDSSSQGGRGERSESSDQGEKGDGDCPPHDGCQDTTEATGGRGRRRESHEGEERASEEERGIVTHLHPL